MIKNILFYNNGPAPNPSLSPILASMGLHCVEFGDAFENSHTDASFVMKVMNYVQSEDIHMVFSGDYVPLLASVCEMKKLPYVSWIGNCPQQELLSKTILYRCNYFFCFDRACANRLAGLGCENVYHFPLAVDTAAFRDVFDGIEEEGLEYAYDISLEEYPQDDRGTRFESEEIPAYVKGYIDGIEEAQIRVYGYNFVREMLEEEVAREILAKAGILQGEMYFDYPIQLAADLINEEISIKEHRRVAEKLNHNIHNYTCKQENKTRLYRNSKINLYITPKTVESGIGQGVLDILAAGGFCLTNYQPETAEFFEDGKEIVMYTDLADLVQKADYYLQHEEEREAIAKAGHEKVMAQFSLHERLTDMLGIVEESIA